MTIRRILVPLDGSDQSKIALQAGIAVGQILAAHVSALHVQHDAKDSIPLLGEGMSVAMIEDMIRIAETEAKERAARARTLFDEATSQASVEISEQPSASGVSAAWSEETGREDDATARRGRLADLIVAARPTSDSDPAATLTLNAALFETGRPVLVVPPGGAATIGRNIAISWNGSAQAARAIGSAIPLIAKAGQVTVFTIQSDRTDARITPDVAEYLTWHGIKSEAKAITGAPSSVGAELLSQATAVGADLLVMGAYTHSRMRQLILGGVTRHVLAAAEISLFMAH